MHSDPLGDGLKLLTVIFRVSEIKDTISICKNVKVWALLVSCCLHLFANLRCFFGTFIVFGSGSYLMLLLFYCSENLYILMRICANLLVITTA